MSRRFPLAVLGIALIALGAGCTASPHAAPPPPARTTTTSPRPTVSADAGMGWAMLMCLTTTSVEQVADGPAEDAPHMMQAAKQSVDSITPTGNPDLDRLTDQLRSSVDAATPKVLAVLGSGGDPGQVVAGIHPDWNELLSAAEAKQDVGDAYFSAASCPRQSLP